MISDGGFRTPEQEVSRLLDELASVREQMRGIAGTLARLELRAKRAFPNVASDRRLRASKGRLSTEATLTPEKALELYDSAVREVKSGSQDKALDLVRNLALPDLLVLHKELGLSLGHSKPSKKMILNGIFGRIKQSVMLSQHSNREHVVNG